MPESRIRVEPAFFDDSLDERLRLLPRVATNLDLSRASSRPESISEILANLDRCAVLERRSLIDDVFFRCSERPLNRSMIRFIAIRYIARDASLVLDRVIEGRGGASVDRAPIYAPAPSRPADRRS